MSLDESIFSLRRNGMRLGLDTMRRLLEVLGSPQRHYRKVIVGGTNGKGSTCATLSSLLSASQVRVGLYTSPHLISFRERFRFREKEIEEAQLQRLIEHVQAIAEKENLKPSFFEYATAIAHLYFSKSEAELAVLEVGLGGRLDATNATPADLAIITDISLDHREYLGGSLTEIAQEKAAIIAPGKLVLTTDQEAPVMRVLEVEAKKKAAKLLILNRDFSLKENPDATLSFQFGSYRLQDFTFPLEGAHQKRNLALALAAFIHLNPMPNREKIKQGLQEVRWPGRFQLISQNPKIILDGAHNEAGIKVLMKTLAEKNISPAKTHLLISIKSDKEWQKMLSLIPTSLASFTATQGRGASDAGDLNFVPVNSLAEEAKRLALSSKIQTFANGEAALSHIKSIVQPDEWIVIAGSLYFVGEILAETRTEA